MSESETSEIRPRSVPLTHVQKDAETGASGGRPPYLGRLIAVVAVIALLVAVFVVIPDLVRKEPGMTAQPASPGQADPVSATPPSAPAPAARPGAPESAPFAALQRERAREKAQEKLAEFVELQLLLEDTMQVGTWGEAQLEEAKRLATEGDEQFLREDFEAALGAYDAATAALSALIETGQGLLDAALAEGEAALNAPDQALAEAQFTLAVTIDPDNAAAEAGMQRAALLPEITTLMRQGKNFELAGQWADALETYEQVQQLDPLTAGLPEALAAARAGATEETIRRHLSEGFAAMDASRYSQARRSFQAALAIDPDNSVARGGMEQVARRTDLSEIEQLRTSAAEAEAAEDWQRAIAGYERVLQLDPNIQFAKDGLERAELQFRTTTALGRIIASPDKLSSPQLFDQAREILARAERLEPRGPTLATQIATVTGLIRTYSTPVSVTLRSDNATQVVLSTVGNIGEFAEKTLTLRPGAYTLIGSRNGYRDVRETMLVRPDMAPFDIRCTETF